MLDPTLIGMPSAIYNTINTLNIVHSFLAGRNLKFKAKDLEQNAKVIKEINKCGKRIEKTVGEDYYKYIGFFNKSPTIEYECPFEGNKLQEE